MQAGNEDAARAARRTGSSSRQGACSSGISARNPPSFSIDPHVKSEKASPEREVAASTVIRGAECTYRTKKGQ